ncbi:periplasmic nitrate reductase, NapE protein [Billgrantia pellis]|uniref:Periplasmic nitrate reductase, NapE protein n=1 Tax=Billgrantia pellis TaxID=2606936 RepID=A0A7V7FWN2_9GAMM|nr:periplasmic nitrate reductase, NapE protein [Halomonas pellis]KAA0009793.1 periplasmic nitrate reductase, NapE protein [Halomonas pellis]
MPRTTDECDTQHEINPHQDRQQKKRELLVFLFLAGVLFPVLAVLVVAGYGFAVWIFQMFTGPPGPPG